MRHMNAFAAALTAPHAPSQAQIARALNVSNATVSEWRTGRRPIPIVQCHPLVRSFAGKVTLCDLRPTDWHLIWPELIGTEGAPEPPGGGADRSVRDGVLHDGRINIGPIR